MKTMIQSKWLAVLLMSFSLFATVGAQNNPCWLKNATIDSKVDEWGSNICYYDKDTQMKYGFANDDQYLYLVFQAVEMPAQMKIMMMGMDVMLKTKVKPKITATLHLNGKKLERPEGDEFRPEGFTPESGSQSPQRRKPNLDLIKQSYLMSLPSLEVEGLVNEKEIIQAGQNGNIEFQVRWNESDQMIIEMRVPLSDLFGPKFSLEQISLKDIAMLVNFPMPQMGDMPFGGPEGRPRGGMGEGGMGEGGHMGGRSRGGMGGSPMGGGHPGGQFAGERGKMYFKASVVLAKQQQK